MTEASEPADGPAQVAALLLANKAELLARWTARVLDDPKVPQANRLSQPALLDDLPHVVDHIVVSLSVVGQTQGHSESTGRRAGVSGNATAHGEHRFSENYTLAEALRELSHVRMSVIDLCEAHGVRLEGQAARVVHAALDEVVSTAASVIAEREQQRTTAELRQRDDERAVLLQNEQQARADAEGARADLHALFMQSPAAICILRGPEHRFALANPFYLRLFGRENIIGRTVAEALPEAEGQGYIQLLDRVYATGEPFVGRALTFDYIPDATGRVESLKLNFVYEPFRDASGQIVGILALVVDVTDIIDAQGKLEAARQLAEHNERAQREARERSDFLVEAGQRLSQNLSLAAALQQVAELVVPRYADAATVVLAEPDGSVRRLAAAPAGAFSTSHDLGGSDRVPSFAPSHPVRRVLDTGETEQLDDVLGLAMAEGNASYVDEIKRAGIKQLMLIALRGQRTTVGAFSAIVTDSGRQISPQDVELLEALGRQAGLAVENARLYEQSDKLRRQAEEASVAKDLFFATISHELRTPLTSILGWAKLLRTTHGEMIDKGLASIERNANAQAQLIEDMLDVSRIVSGQLSIRRSMIEVGPAVEAACDSAQPRATARGVRLERAVDARAGSIMADPERLQQIIWNLVANAIKFTPRGGRVRVSVQRLGDEVELAVDDSGMGIAPEFLPIVFDRFRQAEQGKHGGLGLGLAIVKHIVELHGGAITAASAGKGKGATFTVRLPVNATRPSEEHEGRVSDSGPSSRPLEGAQIVVVDDEPDAREVVTAILQSAGATVRAAASVDEALALVQDSRPDAMVSDIGMPDKDGYELLRLIRALVTTSGERLPVVALTAFARSEDRSRALSAGFASYVPKPVEPTELVIVLTSVLGRELSPPRDK